MANEKRLRLTSLTAGGSPVTLGASLAASTVGASDTVTFNGALAYANGTAVTVGSDQYLPVMLGGDSATFEEI